MKIAMTHEQADFDAIASLFAVSRQFDCYPVLPQNMNHNVRSFLILYGSELPFLELKDLISEDIDDIYLVDTQTLITVKGITPDTKITIIDHHPKRGGKPTLKLPKQKAVELATEETILKLGATTTYFVEIFEKDRRQISAIQASLLLLGIYEDTGTLTYGQTQPRDIRAAAWLLEQGAYLNMLPDFLNPPLTPEQRDIYDQLMDNHTDIVSRGFNIIYSFAEADEKVDEISTLAHKLRDFFDPDAIFIAVKTPEGIRLIGRSQTDEINISEFMRKFGGGGHIRAGSALIQPYNKIPDWQRTLSEKLNELFVVLIKPSITVSKLMSRKPYLLSADMDAGEAEHLMMKYGYEGFPVVENEQLIGLLTRRAVDRAKRHKLNLKVSTLMEPGDFTVEPKDTIQKIQSVMTESGWGQIPVLDPVSKRIIGIVTRTDLIKILGGKKQAIQNVKRIENKLKEQLSTHAHELLLSIARVGHELQLPVYLVGGFVRDLLLGVPSSDFDVVVEGDAIRLGERLVSQFGGELKTHKRFGTGRWTLQGTNFDDPSLPEFIDLISARQEFYEKPSALPSVEAGNIKHDLHRRDFTINTLAVRLDEGHFGELHDYYSGESDLNKKLIRVLHSLSFIDDPTRMIRAARYEGRYGFMVEHRTRQLVSEALPLLSHLSQERLRHEFDLVLIEKENVAILKTLIKWNVVASIEEAIPQADEDVERVALLSEPIHDGIEHLVDLSEPRQYSAVAYCLWFARLGEEAIAAIQEIFGFSEKLATSILDTSCIIHSIESKKLSTRYEKYIALVKRSDVALFASYLITRSQVILDHLIDREKFSMSVSGEDLRECGVKPGPIYQRILSEVMEKALNEDLSPEEQKLVLKKILKENSIV